jgi:hypothetical protein
VPRWVDCHATESFTDFYADFHEAEASTLVMLGFHPSDGPGGRALEAACDAGIPAAVWRRRRCSRNPAAGSADSTGPLAHCEADGVCSVERFERLIVDRLEGRSLESLPWLVRDLRVEAGRTGSGADHCGHDLTLLWDDPTRPDPDSVALVAPTGGQW